MEIYGRTLMELRTRTYRILVGLFHLRKYFAHLEYAICISKLTSGVLLSLALPEFYIVYGASNDLP